MFKKVLIANRGEIALRIHRACKEMGIQTVAVHSTADSNAMHVRMADESVCIGPPPAALSYLSMPNIIAACEITGAEAVHPGYGFLSENAKFVQICEDHEIKFIGPTSEHIRLMGDKITAKETMKNLGVPCVPGSDGGVPTLEDARRIAAEIGYPVIVKATAGGGGRGMKLAKSAAEIDTAFQTARSEAKAAFGNDEVYLEKYLTTPRHIEVQVFGDGKGKAVHLGERDCSLQRRHQKVMEEAPSPAIDAKTRAKIGRTCADAVAKIAYAGAGTIEFLYENGEFYFIEMNTRLQVEHPVTEAIYDVDLVQEQIRVAAGMPMSFSQPDLEAAGHAIECRINAEKLPQFQPSPGTISTYYAPGGLGVRMDSAIYGGYTIPPYYDSLIGKLIVHARTRELALARLRRALSELVVDGVDTTTPLFDALLDEPDIQKGAYNIHWLEKWLAREDSTVRDDAPEVTAALLLRAYASGVFPMAEGAGSDELFWVDPERRGILPLQGLHVPRRLARSFLSDDFEIRVDGDFAGVVAACAEREETWINTPIRGLYRDLHRMGHAHSVEIWCAGALAGGLYGVALGGAFFGESMFSRRRDASKFALVALVARLRAGGFRLLDTQFVTPHLARLGAIEISRAAYHRELAAALPRPADFLALAPGTGRQSLLQLSTQTS